MYGKVYLFLGNSFSVIAGQALPLIDHFHFNFKNSPEAKIYYCHVSFIMFFVCECPYYDLTLREDEQLLEIFVKYVSNLIYFTKVHANQLEYMRVT